MNLNELKAQAVKHCFINARHALFTADEEARDSDLATFLGPDMYHAHVCYSHDWPQGNAPGADVPVWGTKTYVIAGMDGQVLILPYRQVMHVPQKIVMAIIKPNPTH